MKNRKAFIVGIKSTSLSKKELFFLYPATQLLLTTLKLWSLIIASPTWKINGQFVLSLAQSNEYSKL